MTTPLERSDELFWRGQQTRLAGRLAQPCCSLSGMTTLLVRTPGPFAVVVHGEMDCLNCFLPHQGAAGRFYTTRLSQREFVSGRTAEPLRRCLESVIRRRSPEAVLVLGTCLVEMIHDDFEAVAREVEGRTGTPVRTLRTGGLKAGSQAETVDWLYRTLASLGPSSGEARPGSINCVGLPRRGGEGGRGELERLCAAAGLTLNGVYPFEAGLAEWRSIGRARSSFVVDPGLFPGLLSELRERGGRTVEVPLPIGLGPTLRFFRAVAAETGTREAMERALEPGLLEASTRLEAFRARFGGMRLAMGLRMVNNYEADQLAYDGLGDLPFFVEAGFDVRLFIQGPPEEEARTKVRARLESLGCSLPFELFPDPFVLPPLLKAGRFDLAYLAGHAQGEARRAGVPFVRARSLGPFLGGLRRSLDDLERAVAGLGLRP